MNHPILKTDWKTYEVTLPIRALRKHSKKGVAVEIMHVLHNRLPNSIIPLPGGSIEEVETGMEATPAVEGEAD